MQPSLTFDSRGNAVAAWIFGQAHQPASRRVWASVFSANTGRWGDSSGEPGIVSGFGNATMPQVAAAGSGRPIVVWTETGSDGYDIVSAASFSGRFGDPIYRLSGGGHQAGFPQVAVDTSGDALAIWVGIQEVDSSLFQAARLAWLPFTPRSAGGQALFPQVAFDRTGHAIAIWMRSTSGGYLMQAARYDHETNTWGNTVDLSTGGAAGPALTVDRAGNATALWTLISGSHTRIQAARYTAASGTWGSATDISTSGQAEVPRVTVDPVGNVTALWQSGSQLGPQEIQVSRLPLGATQWSSPETISDPTAHAKNQQIASDRLGNVMAIWDQVSGTSSVVYTRRYVLANARWETTTWGIGVGSQPQIAVDGRGNAMAIWIRTGAIGAQAQRWLAAPGAPTITSIASKKRRLSVQFSPPASEPGYAPTNYHYSLNNGVSWVARSPSSTTSPITIKGLQSGQSYSIVLRAINGAGVGIASTTVTAVPK